MQHPETLFDFGVRTTVGYNKNLLNVQDYPQLSATYGIKEPSCFSKLNHFHVVHGFPPDLAHDLFKGFAIDLTTNVVVYFVQEGHLSLRELNDAIEQFDYSESDKKNKPQPFKIKSLNQFKTKETACEMWNLLRLLPLMCGHQIPTDNDVWMLYTKFLQITERLCAMEFSNGDLLALETLLREFFQEYFKFFPEEVVKPKSHFLLHYPYMIKVFGPLVKTLRFEAKHSFFKSSIGLSKNRKNIFQSMAKKHQRFMYLHYQNQNLLSHEEPVATCLKKKTIESFMPYEQEVILESINFFSTDLFCQAKSVSFDGVKYNSGECVVLSFHNDDYRFGLIDSVIFHNARVYLLYKSICFMLYK